MASRQTNQHTATTVAGKLRKSQELPSLKMKAITKMKMIMKMMMKIKMRKVKKDKDAPT